MDPCVTHSPPERLKQAQQQAMADRRKAFTLADAMKKEPKEQQTGLAASGVQNGLQVSCSTSQPDRFVEKELGLQGNSKDVLLIQVKTDFRVIDVRHDGVVVAECNTKLGGLPWLSSCEARSNQ